MPVIGNVTVATDGAWLGAMVMESGPLRSWLRTAVLMTVKFKVNGQDTETTTRFVRDYILCAGEPFLRMTTTGAAPAYTSVMTAFPLTSAVTAITHGTPYHWTDVQPLSGFWGPPLFRPTQDFLLPQDAKGTTMAAVYHAGMPAWAFDAHGALIGCLLRNAPADDGHGASGSDPAPHTQHYALRVPSGLGAPATGQPLREALGFHTPLLAAALPQGQQYKGMLTATTGEPRRPARRQPRGADGGQARQLRSDQPGAAALPADQHGADARGYTARHAKRGRVGDRDRNRMVGRRQRDAGQRRHHRHHGGRGGHRGDRGTGVARMRRRQARAVTSVRFQRPSSRDDPTSVSFVPAAPAPGRSAAPRP